MADKLSPNEKYVLFQLAGTEDDGDIRGLEPNTYDAQVFSARTLQRLFDRELIVYVAGKPRLKP